jgi:hypothetical protein
MVSMEVSIASYTIIKIRCPRSFRMTANFITILLASYRSQKSTNVQYGDQPAMGSIASPHRINFRLSLKSAIGFTLKTWEPILFAQPPVSMVSAQVKFFMSIARHVLRSFWSNSRLRLMKFKSVVLDPWFKSLNVSVVFGLTFIELSPAC